KERARAAFQTFVHRFNRGGDLIVLLELLARSWEKHGSLGAHFLSFLEPETVAEALSALIAEWRMWAAPASRPPSVSAERQARSSGNFEYLLTSPADG